jgi:hypothetical protein
LPIVLGFHGDLQGIWQSVHFGEESQKTHHFCVYGHFCELLPTVLGFWTDLQGHDTRYTFERHDKKLVIFAF